MHRSWGLLIATIALALVPATAGAAGAGCVPGDAASAAAALFGNGTELARFDRVAGLRTALVLEPYIAPGTRHRLIAIDGGWCDAERAFNRAWKLNGRVVGDGAAMSAAYARLAAAPYFDQTSVTSQGSALGAHVLTTHALTNGVVASWTIATDAAGVRDARWIATAYAVKPFVAQWEGVTAVDGVSERYRRSDDGGLSAVNGLPVPEDFAADPGPEVSYTGPDGFKIVVGISDTRNAVDAGQDTNVTQLDLLRMTRDVLAENYQDFYDWGFRADWSVARTRPVLLNSPAQIPAPAKTGYVSINDGTSAACQACVFIADDFQIHFISQVREFLEALGYPYGAASDRDVLSDILGHEMFHDWQNNYSKPDSGRSVPGSYSEGTARFQQTLHRYSPIEHQPTTLLYANDGNGCNGLAGTPPDAAFAAGAFESPAYSACNFWLGWYGAEGLPALVKLVTTGMLYDTSKQPAPTNAEKVMGGIVTATGEPYVVSAAEWAAALITRKNLIWGPAVGTGQAIDWSTYLERWTPVAAVVGGSAARTLANGGVMAVRVTGGAFVPSVTTGAKLAILRDSPAGTALSYPAAGETVPAAADGETIYAIAVWPAKGSKSTKITLAAA